MMMLIIHDVFDVPMLKFSNVINSYINDTCVYEKQTFIRRNIDQYHKIKTRLFSTNLSLTLITLVLI